MPESDFSVLLSGLDLAAFRREGEDHFFALGALPPWAHALLLPGPEPGSYRLTARSFFLEHFLVEAEEFWAGATDGAFRSCAWSEPVLGGMEGGLQATALTQSGRQYLVISPAGKVFAEHRAVLQQARQGLLEHEALIKEVEKKEVLVHCIVHDLANPLAGIIGTLSLLENEPLTPTGQRMMQLAQDACRRQQMLIQQILEVFRAENQTLEAGDLDPHLAPDLLQTARASAEHASASFQRRGVALRLHVEGGDAQPWPVVGERTRLERIFGNLLENALRHTPQGSEVAIRIAGRDGFAEVGIEDAGSGVPEQAIPSLFTKLGSSRAGKPGKAGLGLYFCRITAERWGGSVGYRPTERGSACFWFRLKLLDAAGGA